MFAKFLHEINILETKNSSLKKFDNEKNKSITTSLNPDSDNNYLTGPDNVWQEVTFGQTISLSLKYNFGIKKN